MRYEKHSRPKAAYWSKHVDQWKKSGLLQKDYCAKHGLGLKSFGRWKRILSQSGRDFAATKNGSGPASAQQLIPLSVVSDTETHGADKVARDGNAGIRLHVRGKYAIDVPVGFHCATLQRLLGILN